MKFNLVDKIELIEPSRRIVTRKVLSLAEEYLADHFPTFPVMPGVLMLEALTQSAAWLVRVHQDFANSIVVLESARNVRYGSFVAPGMSLTCDLQAVAIDERSAKFKGEGKLQDGRTAVTARLELKCFNLAERAGYLKDADAQVVEQLRRTFELISGPAALAAARQQA